jgi:hypothetical protein
MEKYFSIFYKYDSSKLGIKEQGKRAQGAPSEGNSEWSKKFKAELNKDKRTAPHNA